MARPNSEYAQDILEAIDNIEEDVAGMSLQTFLADRRTRQATERNIEIISEASRHLPPSLKASEADTPWREIGGIGNVLRHNYASIDDVALWDTVTQNVPATWPGADSRPARGGRTLPVEGRGSPLVPR